jgi:hypothetical protein
MGWNRQLKEEPGGSPNRDQYNESPMAVSSVFRRQMIPISGLTNVRF